MKRLLKRLLRYSPVALTKNQHYDRLTEKVIRSVCQPGSHCIDVGCHKGEILDLMRSAAPKGHHWGFEPIPVLYAALQVKYAGTNCMISPIALSNTTGEAQFNYVTSNPSYSGLLRRHYDRPHEEDTSIRVQTAQMDEVLPGDFPASLIKIDVEGAEMLVLQGARETLSRCKPVVIFEHGIGASDVYGTRPEDLFRFFDSLGFGIFLLEDFLAQKQAFHEEAFKSQYYGKKNFYFVAAPVR
ncbi:MAG: FkbM family methyltransferase [Bacteroidetes bacterium]|nr:FkbM family methyltransferase [Bacteroidota bacterium]